MRNFTLFLLAVCFALTAGATPKGPRKDVKLPAVMMQRLQQFTSNQRKQPQRFNVQQQHAKDTRAMRALHQRSSFTDRAVKRVLAPRRAGIIDQQPAGDYKLYERNGDSYVGTMFGVYENPCVGGLCEVVFGQDDKVYLKNIISQVALPGWIEGTRSGSTITFTLPQTVHSIDGDDYYAMLMAYDADDMTYYGVDGEQTLTLSYDAATGSISSNDDLSTGLLVVGLADMDGYWTGYADWTFTMTEITDEPVEAPEELQTEQFIVKADGFSGCVANVGFLGSDVYVQGIFPDMPEAWVKGTINGDKAVFKNGQFLGADFENLRVQYLISATAESTYVEDPEWGDYTETVYYLSDEDITFDYDAATKTFTGTNLFVVNAGRQEVSYADIYENCVIEPFVEVAATPMAPSDVTLYEEGYDSYAMGFGWGVIEFNQYCNDEDGNYILPDKLSYQLWIRVNGKEMPLVLHTYDYMNLEEDGMTEIPYTYSDNWDIMAEDAYHYAYYYVVGPEAYGVQAIYRGQGEEHRSEIVWADTYDLGSEVQPEAATPEYPDVDPADVGGSIGYGSYTGNENRVTFGEWKPQTYDVAIRLQDEAVVGKYIEDVTFNLRTLNGVSNLKVWLSSQLREEDGQNVPDLVSVDVDMPAKAGNVTVKLPKPYIIPEEGVYVGYSFTLSADAYSMQNNPVTIVDVVKPFGLYIHSTACFLKWLELSELVGGSACINVTLGGSQVKKNAVATIAGDKTYVLSGSDITVNVPFVNHGSEGIRSLDFEYTFNGVTSNQHVDLSSPVSGFFGLTYDHALALPAVSQMGTFDLSVKVLKVNGVDNEEETVAEATTPVFVLNTLPRHRSLLEEYTGLWCGWCPRGFVALELLKEQYPDDYVCVSYHNGDPMEIAYDFPSPIAGYPSAWVDRGMEVDPYSGLEEDGFHVIDVLQWRNAMFGMADLDVKATLADDNSTVDVVADVNFPFSDDAVDCSLEYILVEDGLTGEDWEQANYYSGGADGEMGGFEEKESYVSGLVFNDVAVMQSEMGGIEGSIPTSVTADQPVQHQYSFDLEMAMNTSWEPIIQDYTKLYVVALLIDNATGIVSNAIKVPVTSGTVGIENVNRQVAHSQAIYDLMGRRVVAPQKGIYIVNGRKVVK